MAWVLSYPLLFEAAFTGVDCGPRLTFRTFMRFLDFANLVQERLQQLRA